MKGECFEGGNLDHGRISVDLGPDETVSTALGGLREDGYAGLVADGLVRRGLSNETPGCQSQGNHRGGDRPEQKDPT